MRRLRSLIARALPVAMMASLLALVGGTPAQADAIPTTNWTPVTIGSDLPAAGTVLTDAADGVTVGCPTGSSPTHVFKSFSSTGSVVQNQSVGNPIGSFCTGNATVGKDGTVYIGATSTNGLTQYIQAWKNDSLVWQYQIPCGSNGVPWTMTMGANGNLYATIWQGSSPCNNGVQLIGLTPTAQSGSNPPVPQVVVNMSLWTSIRGGGAAAYDDGMVFYTNSNSVLYVPYSTTSAANLADPITVSNVNYPWAGGDWFQAQPDGTVVLPIKATSGQTVSCASPTSRTGALATVKPNGSVTSTTLTGCWTVHEIHPFPGGGIAMRYAYSDAATSWTDVEKLSAPGWNKEIGDPDLMTRVTMAVDLNGNIAMRNNVTPTYGGYIYPEITFTLISGVTGEFIGTPNLVIALRGEHDTTDGPSYMWGGDGNIAIAKNTVYVTAYQCNRWGVGCQTANTKLYAFTVPGLQMDYPRGAILMHDEPWKEYVALGDSFSSGEGVEPFLAGTNTSGSNRNICHRSEGAYSKLLSGSPGVRLDMTGFRACSGAKTAQITGEWDDAVPDPVNLGEHPQIEALSSSTKVVTISIGGNDIGFADFVKQCLFVDCSDSSMNESFFDAVDGLGSTLSGLYDDVLTEAPNATVYVIGYPQLFPDPSNCSNPLGAGVMAFNSLVQSAHNSVPGATDAVVLVGQWLGMSSSQINSLITAGQITFTSNEIAAGRSLTTALNDEISATVTGMSESRLKFVSATAGSSPFFGRELCTSTPYFNGLDLVNPSYSFHPNQLGQDAYRQLLLTQL